MMLTTLLALSTLLPGAATATPLPVRAAISQYQRGQYQRGQWRARRDGAATGAQSDAGGRGQGRLSGINAEGRRGTPSETIRFGSDPQQGIDYYRPATPLSARPPLAIFIHGGGWSMGDRSMVDAKPTWFGAHGWAFAAVGYRLVPGASVEDEARDVAAGIRAIRAQAARLGFDPDRILLMGHSAGAHLAALVSSDTQWLGADLAAIKGTLLLDGAGYDVPRQMQAAPFLAQRLYVPAFGTDVARQTALSPITYAAAPNVPDWLIVYSTQRHDSPGQARGLGEALLRAHTAVTYAPIDANHGDINRQFGTEGYAVSPAVEAIMTRVAGAR